MKLVSKPKSSLASSLLAAMTASAGLLPVGSAFADTLYWDGTGASWGVASGWSTASDATTPDPVAAPGAADEVVFNLSTLNTNQVVGFGGANQAANSLAFNSTGAVTLGGGGNRDLAIGGGGITIASGAGVATIGAATSGQNVFVRLAESQTWTNNSANLLTSRNSTTGLATGNAPVTLTLSATSTGGITNSGALNDGAAGAVVSLVVDSSGTGVSSNGGGNYSGGTTILSGILNTSGTTPLGAGTGAVTLGNTSGTALATLNINSAVTVANNITVRAGSSGVKTLGSSTNVILGGTLTLNDNLVFSPSGGTTTVNGVISGVGAIAKSGGAALTLAGNNTYSGGTTLNAAGGTLNINNGGTDATNSAIGTGALTILGGTINNTSGSAVTLATNNAISLGANFTFTGTNDLNLGTGAVTLNGSSGARTIAVSSGALTLGGVIGSGTATGLTKTGNGTLRLTNPANTYTGGTAFGSSGVIGGVIEVTKLSNGGVASSIGASSNANGNLIFGGVTTPGTLRYIGTGDSTDRRFQMGGIGANIESSGTGALNFTNSASPTYSTGTSPGSLSLGGTNTDANTFASVITNPSGNVTSLTKHGAGRWILSGSNTYTGATTINAGTLQLGAANRIADASNLVLGGGTFATGGFSETLGTLSLGGDSFIDFGDGGSALVFADSSALSWTGSVSLSLINFTEGLDSIRFGTTSGGLTGTQLGQITINGLAATIDANGFLSASAIPEPSSFAGLAGAAGLLIAASRRRRRSV